MALITNKGVKYEETHEWPQVTKVFNVFAFDYPNKTSTSDLQAPFQRAQGYPAYPKSGFTARGAPQLTWFEGTYDVYAHQGNNPAICKYPHLIGPQDSKGKRMCLNPNSLTDAERAAIAAEKARIEASIALSITEMQKKTPEADCTQWFQSPWSSNQTKPSYYPSDATMLTSGGKYAWKYQGLRSRDDSKKKVFRKATSGGAADVYDCATGKKLYSVKAETVKGLGSSELEDEALAKRKSLYRTTELSLLAAVAVGLFLIWRK